MALPGKAESRLSPEQDFILIFIREDVEYRSRVLQSLPGFQSSLPDEINLYRPKGLLK